MTRHVGGAPTQRVPMHTRAAAEEEIDMVDVDGLTVGSKRKNRSGAQADDTQNTTPSKKGLTHNFDCLFREAMAKAASKPLLICGDFNALHTHWGYGSASPKGRRLAELVDNLGLTLLNEPMSHTRIGQDLCRDTTPDLSMCVNTDVVSWKNNEKEDPIKNIGSWCKKILSDVEKATKEIEWAYWWEEEGPGDGRTEAPDPTRVDSHLAHLLLAKKLMQHRESEELCNTMDGNMSAARTWKILKHLLDPTSTRTTVQTEMAKLRHKYKGDLEALMDEIVRTHLTRTEGLDNAEYTGAPNEELDADFSVQEIRVVLQPVKMKSAPGPDKITNKILRNLDDNAIVNLCEYVNECRRTGRVPRKWEIADVVLIPKPGKQPVVKNMRPISLTSCVGKVIENAYLNRVVTLLERRNAFGTHIIGFRKGLSTTVLNAAD
ncbi:uncharacterized protein LOC142772299 [Rhipicephalus microplus]|uniref:uncharacterized protein LOC142772299 n=1 Tax=Rhipicephalus microplus TaxID=6941 RepID=UPI003F6B384E